MCGGAAAAVAEAPAAYVLMQERRVRMLNGRADSGARQARALPVAELRGKNAAQGRAGGRAGAYAGAAQQRVDMAIACEGNAAGRFLHPDLYRQAALFAVDEEQDPEAQQPPPPLQEQGTQRRSARGGQSLHREDSGVGAAAALPQSHPVSTRRCCCVCLHHGTLGQQL